MGWQELLLIIAGALMVWLAIRIVRGNPKAFSKGNMSKSVTTMGLLTLFLIAIVVVCIIILRS